jgi:iron-sulfur cluster assembly protein
MLTLTDAAKNRVKDLVSDETGSQLRIFVQGGGCSGFQYGLAFDEPRDGDDTIEMEGFSILVDKWSKPYLDDVTVDFVDSLTGAGFKFENPNATGSCGCGSSFSV